MSDMACSFTQTHGDEILLAYRQPIIWYMKMVISPHVIVSSSVQTNGTGNSAAQRTRDTLHVGRGKEFVWRGNEWTHGRCSAR